MSKFGQRHRCGVPRHPPGPASAMILIIIPPWLPSSRGILSPSLPARPHSFVQVRRSVASRVAGLKKISRTLNCLRVARRLARQCHCLVHVRAFQYPKTADVFLGLKVRPVGDEDSAIGLRSHRHRGPKAASEFPDASSNHLIIEFVDLGPVASSAWDGSKSSGR